MDYFLLKAPIILDILEYICKLHIVDGNYPGGRTVATIEKANKAAENLAHSTSDAYRVVIDHSVAVGERNVRFSQDILNSITREVRQQAESNRAVTQELVERAEKQRDAFQTLVEESVDAYMDLAYAPFSYFKQGLRLVESEVKRGGFPIADYDNLTVEEIGKQLDRLTAAQLREVRDYEKKNKNRDTLIEQFDRKLKAVSA